MIIIKFIILLILIIVLLFLIWKTFFAKKKKEDYTPKAEPEDIKEKIFNLLIELAEDDRLKKEDRIKIYDKFEELIQILKTLDSMEINSVTRYEIEKIVSDYLYKLVRGFLNSPDRNIDLLLEGIDIIKAQLEKIKETYDTNREDLNKEVEFLKRKFLV